MRKAQKTVLLCMLFFFGGHFFNVSVAQDRKTEPDTTIKWCPSSQVNVLKGNIKKETEWWMKLPDSTWKNVEIDKPLLDSLLKTTDSLDVRCVGGDNNIDTVWSRVIPFRAGRIVIGTTTDTTICFGTELSTITFSESPSGGDGSYTYRWEKSLDKTQNGSWDSIVNGTECKPGMLNSTYYYRVVVGSAACPKDFDITNVVTIKVREKLTAGRIAIGANDTDITICYGSRLDKIFFETGPKYEAVYYQWMVSSDLASWKTIDDTYGKVFQPDILESTHYYRVVVHSSACPQDTAITNVVTVKVLPKFMPGSIVLAGNKNVDTTVCYHTPSGCLEISDSATGGALPYSYQWQHFSNGGYVDIADSNRESYCPKDSLVQSEYYRLKFISSYGCGAVYSNPVSVHVYPPLTRAKLDVPADTVKVCPGASPGKIPVKISAKGGCGKVNNQWQVKDANGNFKDIADTVIDTLKIMKEMSFRLKSFSECCGDTVFSDTITFSPYPKLIAGKIDKDETICYHTQPSKLFFSESPSGGDGSYTYQWEESSNNILWNVVSGKHVEYQPDILVTTHYYRVVVGSAACPQDTAITNAVTVSVLPEFKPGEVSISGVSSGRDTFCQKIMPDTLKATAATGGKQPYEYQWQSFSNGSYNDINGAKTVILTGIKPSVYYRMKYSSSCGVAYSAPVAVHVYPPLTPAVLETPSSTMVCEGSSLGTLSVKSSASGGCGKVRNQWQVKTANGDFKDMADAETETLNVGEIKEEMSFRLKSFSECCDDTVYSVPVTFSLYPKLSAGKIGKDETICHHTKPSELVFIVNPSGGNGSYTYQWYESKDAIKWDMVHGKHISYQPDTLDATHYYRVVVSSGCPQETDTTNMVEVKVREKLNAGKIYGKPFVCEQSNPRLSFSDLPTGSSGQYHYQWQTSSDFSSFKPVLSNDTICYHDSMAFDSVGMRYYRVLVTSDGCPEDTALTDVMLVKSVPLPEVQRIYGGGDTVCYFQEVTYYVDTLFDACAYEWGLSSNQGVIQSVSNNKVSILWVNNYMEDSVVLKVTDTLANCVQRNARKINISTNKVPEQVKLYRKTNSNVLIADDYSEKLYYRWGYTDKNDASDYFIDSANRRYARFPHLDTKHYFYWLRLSAVKGDSCYSQSVFDETVAQYDIELETGDVRVFVTSPSTISIIVENPKMEQVECRILTPLGQLLYHGQWGRNEYLRQAVPMNVAAGVYFVHVRVGKDVYVKKAVVR